MVVYVEYAIIDNIILDALIIYLVAISLHTKFNKLNVTLSLVQGVTYAIITPFITASVFFTAIIKVVFSLLIVLSLNKYKNIKQYIVTYMLFLSFTFVLGGVCYALLNMFKIPYNQNGILLNGYALPISIFVFIAFVYVFVFIKFLKNYLKHKQTRCSTYDVTITIDGKKYYIRGFLDSGNRLYDDNNPIVVISFACFCKIFKNFPFEKIMLDRVSGVDLKNAHYINVATATSSAKMLVFNCDSIQICHDDINIKKTNVAMGVSKKNFSQFECLLHEGLL